MDTKIMLSESMENYLETIFELETKNKVARAKDIAANLGLQRGSVTGALKILAGHDLIHYKPYNYITLTRKGKELAKEIVHCHEVLKDFLLNVLRIDPETADQTACRMEHIIDKTTLNRMICFIEYIRTCPKTGENWIQSFVDFCEANECGSDELD